MSHESLENYRGDVMSTGGVNGPMGACTYQRLMYTKVIQHRNGRAANSFRFVVCRFTGRSALVSGRQEARKLAYLLETNLLHRLDSRARLGARVPRWCNLCTRLHHVDEITRL